jgi:hypothetical protein
MADPNLIDKPNYESVAAPKWSVQKLLLLFGIVLIFFTAILAARFIWEETSLTIQEGPQMVGFSLAHGFGAILYFAPVLLILWLLMTIITLVVILFRRKPLPKSLAVSAIAAALVLGLLSIPQAFWQYLFITEFAASPHAGELACYAAGEGEHRTVEAYIIRGVPLESRNYYGSTLMFCAAAGGNLDTVSLLATRGSQLNATNLYGDSPLAAAEGKKHSDVAAFLRQRGAVAIFGTKEQREAASRAIVARDIERMNHRK